MNKDIHTHTETAEGASQRNERQPTKKNVISEVEHKSRSKTNRNSRQEETGPNRAGHFFCPYGKENKQKHKTEQNALEESQSNVARGCKCTIPGIQDVEGAGSQIRSEHDLSKDTSLVIETLFSIILLDFVEIIKTLMLFLISYFTFNSL